MNSIVIIGRLTRDPELRYTQAGTPVCNFTLAVDRPAREGEEKKADFIPVSVFGKSAESCAKYLSKGRQAAVKGRIQTGSYVDREGVKRSTFEIMSDQVKFLDPAQKTSPRATESRTEASAYGRQLSISEQDDIPGSFMPVEDDFDY